MAAPLKLGLLVTTVPATHIVQVAQAAEAMGFDDVWTGEHFALHRDDWWEDESAVVAKRKAGLPTGPQDAHVRPTDLFEDAVTLMAAVAGATSRIRLGFGIYLLALRHPILAARAMITLDRVSNGRMEMCVGLGWSKGEFKALGVDWDTRAERYDEALQATRILLRDEYPEFHGKHFDFGPLGFNPKPVQQPVPIRMGGNSRIGARRAALQADGWFGSVDQFDYIRQVREEAGLTNPFDFVALQYTGKPATRMELEDIAAKGAVKASAVAFTRFVSVDDCVRRMEAVAKEAGLI